MQPVRSHRLRTASHVAQPRSSRNASGASLNSFGGRAVAVALNETAAPALQTAEVLLSRPMIDLPAVTDAAQRLQIGITF
jgi:hypothetical protein